MVSYYLLLTIHLFTAFSTSPSYSRNAFSISIPILPKVAIYNPIIPNA